MAWGLKNEWEQVKKKVYLLVRGLFKVPDRKTLGGLLTFASKDHT